MKYLLLMLLSQPLMAIAQPYALLHRELLHPVTVAAQLESRTIAGRYFPVHAGDLDVMIKTVELYRVSLEQKEPLLIEKEIKLGNSRLHIYQPNDKQKGLSVILFTRAKDHGFSYALVQRSDTKKRALQKINAFLYYLRNNRFLVQESVSAMMITPF